MTLAWPVETFISWQSLSFARELSKAVWLECCLHYHFYFCNMVVTICCVLARTWHHSYSSNVWYVHRLIVMINLVASEEVQTDWKIQAHISSLSIIHNAFQQKHVHFSNSNSCNTVDKCYIQLSLLWTTSLKLFRIDNYISNNWNLCITNTYG